MKAKDSFLFVGKLFLVATVAAVLCPTPSISATIGNTQATYYPTLAATEGTFYLVNASTLEATAVTATAAQLNASASVTAGTVTASKAVVVDSNKDIGDFRNLDAVNFDAGSSGVAGTLDVFPTTAATGKTVITATSNAGDTVTTITNASQAGARTYTIPDAGASASFVMTEGAQTVNGTKTIPALVTTNIDAGADAVAGTVDIFPATTASGKIQILAANSAGAFTTTITNASQAAARTYTIPDAGGAASFVMTEGAQTINGTKTIPAIVTTNIYQGGAAAAATSVHRMVLKKTSIADNTATGFLQITVPNANHAATVNITLMSSNGSTDAFESTRAAVGQVVLARTTGVDTVATAIALTNAGIATVGSGATHTLAYDLTAMTGASSATQTFDVRVTIDDSGNTGSNQVVALCELVNAEATGVTMAGL